MFFDGLVSVCCLIDANCAPIGSLIAALGDGTWFEIDGGRLASGGGANGMRVGISHVVKSTIKLHSYIEMVLAIQYIYNIAHL
jgi:hypothetical protein